MTFCGAPILTNKQTHTNSRRAADPPANGTFWRAQSEDERYVMKPSNTDKRAIGGNREAIATLCDIRDVRSRTVFIASSLRSVTACNLGITGSLVSLVIGWLFSIVLIIRPYSLDCQKCAAPVSSGTSFSDSRSATSQDGRKCLRSRFRSRNVHFK